MHFPYGIRTRQEGTMMLTALRLFSCRGLSAVLTLHPYHGYRGSAEVLNTGVGFSGLWRFAPPAF